MDSTWCAKTRGGARACSAPATTSTCSASADVRPRRAGRYALAGRPGNGAQASRGARPRRHHDLPRRLDGMFAFAIWDAHARRLFAARDRLGIKPLFYSTRRGLALASTLAPFLALEGFPRTLDYEALRDYLAFQAPLAPHTFLR